MAEGELTADELQMLLSLVRREIEANRYPVSDRARRLRALRDRLEDTVGEPAGGEIRRRRG